MIKYLLKFVSKEDHANTLLDGTLFMRPACYYHKLENGQGDVCESAVSHEICMYKHSHVPIYCTYAVDEKDMIGGVVDISGQCIRDFKCENGYVVIIDFSQFEQILPTLQSKGAEVDAGLVHYHKLTFDDMAYLIGDTTPKNLFLKPPFFSYQKEFRIIVCQEVYKMGEPPIDHVMYHFPQDLRDIAVSRKISSFKQGDRYLINLEQETIMPIPQI